LGDISAKTTGCVEFPDKDILINMLLDANLYQTQDKPVQILMEFFQQGITLSAFHKSARTVSTSVTSRLI